MQSLNVGDQSVVPFQSVNIGEFNETDNNSTVKSVCSHRDGPFIVATNLVWSCIKVTATLRFDAKTFATPADVTDSVSLMLPIKTQGMYSV